MKKRVLITSAVTILLCLCLIAGSTFALFTSSSSASIVVQAARVNVSAKISGLKVYSRDVECTTQDPAGNIIFVNGGTAGLIGNKLTLDKMTPGDKVTFTIDVANGSNIITKCRVRTVINDGDGMTEGEYGLNVTCTPTGLDMSGDWFVLQPARDPNGDHMGSITVTVELPVDADNTYQGMRYTMDIIVEAVQGNG